MPGTFSPPPTAREIASWRSRHASRHVGGACALMHVGNGNPRLRWNHSRHFQRMHNPQFYVYGGRPIGIRCIKFTFSTKIIYTGVSDCATGCPCRALYCGLLSCLIFTATLFLDDMLVASNVNWTDVCVYTCINTAISNRINHSHTTIRRIKKSNDMSRVGWNHKHQYQIRTSEVPKLVRLLYLLLVIMYRLWFLINTYMVLAS